MSKGFTAPIIIIAVVVFAVVFAAAYYFNKPSVSKTSQPVPVVQNSASFSSTQDETKDWKTYTNTKNKYSISYPADWRTEPIVVGAGNGEARPNDPSLSIYKIGEANNGDGVNINVSSIAIPEVLLLKNTNKSEIEINGIKMDKYQYSNKEVAVYYFQLENGKFIDMSFSNIAKDTAKREIFNKMLSSFKFMN
ncbi:MAG: hypothetical protein Q7R43_02160 [Candidatus Daviesbacteria bacterium]|nr:hypothetical protein [Candidatus Daviesbacteria bacterium]